MLHIFAICSADDTDRREKVSAVARHAGADVTFAETAEELCAAISAAKAIPLEGMRGPVSPVVRHQQALSALLTEGATTVVVLASNGFAAADLMEQLAMKQLV